MRSLIMLRSESSPTSVSTVTSQMPPPSSSARQMGYPMAITVTMTIGSSQSSAASQASFRSMAWSAQSDANVSSKVRRGVRPAQVSRQNNQS